MHALQEIIAEIALFCFNIPKRWGLVLSLLITLWINYDDFKALLEPHIIKEESTAGSILLANHLQPKEELTLFLNNTLQKLESSSKTVAFPGSVTPYNY